MMKAVYILLTAVKNIFLGDSWRSAIIYLPIFTLKLITFLFIIITDFTLNIGHMSTILTKKQSTEKMGLGLSTKTKMPKWLFTRQLGSGMAMVYWFLPQISVPVQNYPDPVTSDIKINQINNE